jgi:hypothetical protein
VTVVNVPTAGVILPIVMLLIEPVIVGLIDNTPEPVGLRVIVELFPVHDKLPVTVSEVNVPAAGTFAPIVTLSILPVVAGLIATVPDPVGEIVTFPVLGLNETEVVAVNVVNCPLLGVVSPIVVLLIEPVVDGFAVNWSVTVKLANEITLLALKVTVFVVLLVVIEIPFPPTSVNVLLIGVKLIVGCPATPKYV